MIRRLLIGLAGVAMLVGCAASRPLLDRSVVTSSASPVEMAAASPEDAPVVNWGGRVIELRAAGDNSEIEVLGYPVRNSGRPDDLADSNGRFIALGRGNIDPLRFPVGTLVTLTGKVVRIDEGRIGDRVVRLPVVEVIEMSPVPARHDPVQPFFSIGVGIGF